MVDEIAVLARRRYNAHCKRSKELSLSPPKYNDIFTLIKNSIDGGSKCYYCNKIMKMHDIPPYKDTYSIDHKVPTTLGGTNDPQNMVVCCTECNIIKSTMTANTFVRLIKIILDNDPLLLSVMFNELWSGKLANKIEREEPINTHPPM